MPGFLSITSARYNSTFLVSQTLTNAHPMEDWAHVNRRAPIQLGRTTAAANLVTNCQPTAHTAMVSILLQACSALLFCHSTVFRGCPIHSGHVLKRSIYIRYNHAGSGYHCMRDHTHHLQQR